MAVLGIGMGQFNKSVKRWYPEGMVDELDVWRGKLYAGQSDDWYLSVTKCVRALELNPPETLESLVDDTGTTWNYLLFEELNGACVFSCEPVGKTVYVPDGLGGLPVIALASRMFLDQRGLEEIQLSDNIVLMGPSAFRGCFNLERVKLSAQLREPDFSWFIGCNAMRELVLPDGLETVNADALIAPKIKVLHIGSAAKTIKPGTFAKSVLEEINISEDNPDFTTDGKAIYSKDGSTLVALAVPVQDYTIDPAVRVIAERAMSEFSCLENVELPPALERVEDFAFTQTSIASFDAPATLHSIGEKAFFRCRNLEAVTLNEGLTNIGEDAFSSSGIAALRLPSTITTFGDIIAADTALTYVGPEASFTLAPGSENLELDEFGGLYRMEDDGLVFVRLMNARASEYAVRPGTVRVNERAFTRHGAIERVTLPEGITQIGRVAFKDCRKLVEVSLPSTLERIEDEAFLDTALESAFLPAKLEYVGRNALVTYQMHNGRRPSTLTHVEVDPDNKHFYVDSGMLLHWVGANMSEVLLYTGEVEDVVVPPEVIRILPYAFNGTTSVHSLVLSNRITDVGVCGLQINCIPELIRVDLVEPIEGHDHFDFAFPDADRTIHQLSFAIGQPSLVDPEIIFFYYDGAIGNTSSYGRSGEKSKKYGLYDQAVKVVERMVDPVFMSANARNIFDGLLRVQTIEICVELARHDDRRTLDALLDLGYLNADNIVEAIERVGVLQDAAMTGYLLEQRRLRFESDENGFGFDFDL